MIHDLLREGGYSVIQHGPSPGASLAAGEAHSGPIHLLIMPRLSGREAAARIKSTHPEVRVLYMSGYANAAVGHQGCLPEHHAFLQNPFSLEALLRKVREVLDLPE